MMIDRIYFWYVQENGIMETEEVNHGGAMNLSLSNKENRSVTPNGEIIGENGDAMPHLSPQVTTAVNLPLS